MGSWQAVAPGCQMGLCRTWRNLSVIVGLYAFATPPLVSKAAGQSSRLAFLNNPDEFTRRVSQQENSTFLVVAFAPDADPADVPPVYGSVTPLGDGSYSVSYTPTYADT